MLIRMIVNILLAFCLLSPTFGRRASVTSKVTEESKKISNAAEVLNTASKETAELLGISEEEAKQQILEAITSKNGLDKNGQPFVQGTANCFQSQDPLRAAVSTSFCQFIRPAFHIKDQKSPFHLIYLSG